MTRPISYIFDASWKYATIIQCHFRRVTNVHDASKTCSFILDASRMNEHFLEALKNSVTLDKTRQLHQRIKIRLTT